MEAVRIEALTKKYKDVVAVDGISLTINKGELFSLLGVNGAGKTTTVKMLCTLVKADGGNAFLNGRSILTDGAQIKSIIALSPQETAVAGGLSVIENLTLMGELHGFSKEKTAEKTKELCSDLGLEAVKNKKASKLSGGYQRRLSIGMALISDPEILFLDEPTLGLDVLARSDLWDIIKKLKGKTTVILTTHYMEEAEELSDRVGIMKNGRLLVCDTPQNIKIMTGCESFEKAFVKVVKEGIK